MTKFFISFSNNNLLYKKINHNTEYFSNFKREQEWTHPSAQAALTRSVTKVEVVLPTKRRLAADLNPKSSVTNLPPHKDLNLDAEKAKTTKRPALTAKRPRANPTTAPKTSQSPPPMPKNQQRVPKSPQPPNGGADPREKLMKWRMRMRTRGRVPPPRSPRRPKRLRDPLPSKGEALERQAKEDHIVQMIVAEVMMAEVAAPVLLAKRKSIRSKQPRRVDLAAIRNL